MTTFKINAHTTEREMWARNDEILTHCERHFMRTDSQTWRFFENVDRRLQRARGPIGSVLQTSKAGNRRSGKLEPFDCMPGALPPGDDEPATPAPVTVPEVVSMPTCAGCGPARWSASPLRRP